jgi:hypothetical protein
MHVTNIRERSRSPRRETDVIASVRHRRDYIATVPNSMAPNGSQTVVMEQLAKSNTLPTAPKTAGNPIRLGGGDRSVSGNAQSLFACFRSAQLSVTNGAETSHRRHEAMSVGRRSPEA